MSEEEIRVLKTCVCQSLSNRSELSYKVGCNSCLDVFLCIHVNSGSGMHSKQWIKLQAIEQLLSSAKKTITSRTLVPLFKGRSTNSAGFFMAILKNEGLIKNTDPNSRDFVRCDLSVFIKSVHTLMNIDEGKQPPQKKPVKEKESKTTEEC